MGAIGIQHLFGSDSDFSDFTKNIHITFDDMIHKAVIEADEDGAVAAAATGIFTFANAIMETEPINFHCDHPFIFMINDRIANEILFAGVYRGPNESSP